MNHTPPPGFSEFRPYPKQGMPVKIRKPMKKRRGPRKNASRVISPDFLAFIRSQPCACGCACCDPSQPHHVLPRKWAESTRNDYTCVPLCAKCHNDAETYDLEKFARVHGLNLWEVNRDMVSLYEKIRGLTIPQAGRVYLRKLGDA